MNLLITGGAGFIGVHQPGTSQRLDALCGLYRADVRTEDAI